MKNINAVLSGYRGVSAEYPFGPQPRVFKVGGKMFAYLTENDDPAWLTLKCDPERAEELRQTYPTIRPGYYMNKRHWNTIVLDGTVPSDEILEMVTHSYDLVVASLTRAARRELQSEES